MQQGCFQSVYTTPLFCAVHGTLWRGTGRYLPPPIYEPLANRTPDSSLSNREREVLGLLVHGKTNREIANELGITEATVKCHVGIIMMRLNANDRTQAVVIAGQRRLIHL